MTSKSRVPAGRPWTTAISYSRAVRKGPLIEVSGTTSTSTAGEVLFPEDAYQQAKHALSAMISAIEQLGGTADDVVRTRVFLADANDWEAVGRAHDEVLRDVAPASTVVEVSRFLLPGLLVELEATAYVDGDLGPSS